MEPEAECILVVIGATPEGKKELVGFHVGRRESAQSWRELLVDLKARGLAVAPEIAVGDGALGFWKALDEVFPGARHQRCWVHKVSNVLNKFPKSMAPTVKSDLRDIWQAETRAAAEAAMDTFAEKYGTKYGNAVACLTKDREALLAFFDFPAEHWDHLRTANPIESVFATVRHRTVRTKGALSQKTAKLMVFTLVRAASKKWRRLKGANQLPLVVDGIKFTDGVAVGDAETAPPDQAASPRFSHSSRSPAATASSSTISPASSATRRAATRASRYSPSSTATARTASRCSLQTISAVMGTYAATAPFETFAGTRLDRHPTDLAGLRGARLVTVTETERGRSWSETRIKTVTGGDPIRVRFIGRDFFEFRPNFKLIVAGNHRPAFHGVGEAMRRRLHVVPFGVTFTEAQRDRTLAERLLAERDGILGWIIEGCLAWQRLGLNPPRAVRSAADEYFADEDMTGQWIAESLPCWTGEKATARELFESWSAWARDNGIEPGSQKTLGEALRSRGLVPGKVGSSRGWIGISPRSPS